MGSAPARRPDAGSHEGLRTEDALSIATDQDHRVRRPRQHGFAHGRAAGRQGLCRWRFTTAGRRWRMPSWPHMAAASRRALPMRAGRGCRDHHAAGRPHGARGRAGRGWSRGVDRRRRNNHRHEHVRSAHHGRDRRGAGGAQYSLRGRAGDGRRGVRARRLARRDGRRRRCGHRALHAGLP